MFLIISAIQSAEKAHKGAAASGLVRTISRANKERVNATAFSAVK